jgi:hypothetical protein
VPSIITKKGEREALGALDNNVSPFTEMLMQAWRYRF